MEVYKDLSNPASKEFENLLNNQLSKITIEEGKIIEGKVNKITEKFVFLHVDGLKSEPVLDINELKGMGFSEKIKIGEIIPVLLERLEDKMGEVVVSASKAQKIKGWESLVSKYEKDESVMGKITGRVKGGAIVQHIDTGTLMFLPGSQISSQPLKNIDHLINEVQKFKIIKLDRVRGNICCSRKEIVDAGKKQDKAEIIKKYPVGTIIKNAKVKNLSSFGCFCSVNDELDVLIHTSELSYSRINNPDELYSIGDTIDLKVISVDETKLQVGCSVKQLFPDPFDHIDNYQLNKIYTAKIVKITQFGAFAELEVGLTTLLHNSELSYTKKNASAQKMFKINQEIPVVIREIDKDKRRISVSYKLTQENPFETFAKRFPVDTITEGEVVEKNEYALFVKIDNLECHAFLHANDLTFLNDSEKELEKYQKGTRIKVKILEIKPEEQKIRVGHRQTQKDPFDYFSEKSVGDILTVKVISAENKGLVVKPEGCDLDFLIKKSEIAINPADARPSRWTGGEKVDVGIKEIFHDKRKVTLSIKFLEEKDREIALKTYGSEASGKNLPFSSLKDEIKKSEDTKKKEK